MAFPLNYEYQYYCNTDLLAGLVSLVCCMKSHFLNYPFKL